MSFTVVQSPVKEPEVLSLSSIKMKNCTLEDQGTSRPSVKVTINDCSQGLGIKIIGGASDEEDEDDRDFGIFIKKVLEGGLASQEGILQEGDQIISVNGESLELCTNEQAVSLLRQASAINHVELEVCRDEKAREEFIDLLNAYSYSSASSSYSMSSSRSNTSSVHAATHQWAMSADPHIQSPRTHSPSIPSLMSPSMYDQLRGKGLSPSSIEMLPIHAAAHQSSDNTTPIQPKVQNAAAASLHHRGLMSAPNMASTPQDATGSLKPGKLHSPPGGASGGSYQHVSGYEPSPVTGSYGAAMDTHGATGFSSIDQSTTKFSLDPHVRLKIEKLEVALRYLGLDPSEEQQEELRGRLSVDSNGSVTYGEFVRIAGDVFKFQLEDRSLPPAKSFSSHFQDFTQPPAFGSQNNTQDYHNEDLARVTQERDELKNEVHRLKLLLKEKELSCTLAENELLRVRQEAQGAIHENRSMKTKMQLAEQAQQQARNMEMDYEEVVKLLEKEIGALKAGGPTPGGGDSLALQKRVAVVSCQLRKAEVSKKTYEVATEKLLGFVENCHTVLSRNAESLPRSDNEKGAKNSKQPRLKKAQSPYGLIQDSRDTVKAVKSLVETEPLPFGWEEAYTTDGVKYYINHVTQVTTWQHPISMVQHDESAAPKYKPVSIDRTARRSRGKEQTT